MKGLWALVGAFLVASMVIVSSDPGRADEGGCVLDSDGVAVCPPIGGVCLLDVEGHAACSPPEGGIILDNLSGVLVCGPGHCVQQPDGPIYCSKIKRGYGIVDMDNRVKCMGGCVRASAAACLRPRKSRQ